MPLACYATAFYALYIDVKVEVFNSLMDLVCALNFKVKYIFFSFSFMIIVSLTLTLTSSEACYWEDNASEKNETRLKKRLELPITPGGRLPL